MVRTVPFQGAGTDRGCSRLSHGEHRTECIANDVLRDAAQEHVLNPSATVSSLHDQVDVILGRVLGDLVNRSTDARRTVDRQFPGPFRPRKLRELIFRLLAEFRKPLGERREGLTRS